MLLHYIFHSSSKSVSQKSFLFLKINIRFKLLFLCTYLLNTYLFNTSRQMIKLMMMTASITMVINITRKVSNPPGSSVFGSDFDNWDLNLSKYCSAFFGTHPQCLHSNISLGIEVHCLRQNQSIVGSSWRKPFQWIPSNEWWL